MMDFVSVDVETANSFMSSICQIGIAEYKSGQLINEWSSLVNPKTYFDPINISIHGISEEDVVSFPTFREVEEIVRERLTGKITVCHTLFDKNSINLALEDISQPEIDTYWLNSARIARRTWPQVARKGYGLGNVAEIIGFDFKHHDALEDAKAAARIVLEASKITGLDLNGWMKRTRQPLDPEHAKQIADIRRDGNPEGELYGEVVAFTGALQISRSQAADYAASLGCTVGSGVTSKTTMLVLGDQDLLKLNGKKKSSKHLKAEKLISEGQNIRILSESDFIRLVPELDY